MAATYTKGNTSDRNRLRLKIQDTPPNGAAEWPAGDAALFDDDELDDLLEDEGSVILAAAAALEALATRYSRDVDFTADGSSFMLSKRVDGLRREARRLRAKGRGIGVTPPKRVDGYSDDVVSDEVDASSSATFDRALVE